jgi:hypothetical protein
VVGSGIIVYDVVEGAAVVDIPNAHVAAISNLISLYNGFVFIFFFLFLLFPQGTSN